MTEVLAQYLCWCLLLCTQWAAVTSHRSLTSVPPQNGSNLLAVTRNCEGGLLSMIL